MKKKLVYSLTISNLIFNYLHTMESPQIALSRAAYWGNVKKVKEILETKLDEIDINYIDYSGRTALHSVSRSIQGFKEDRFEIIQLLLEYKADTSIKDRDGKTALEIHLHATKHINLLPESTQE